MIKFKPEQNQKFLLLGYDKLVEFEKELLTLKELQLIYSESSKRIRFNLSGI
jgi:hypothetical protein